MRYFKPTDILLPDFSRTDGEKWAVIACDQFTGEPEYWHEVEEKVQDAPSTLRVILPECYLGKEDDKRIAAIHQSMEKYIESTLLCHESTMIYLRRTLPDGRVRTGLVAALDLEAYDYSAQSQSPIRPTEGTVLSRIPPRVRVRREASLEAPHVMILIDDKTNSVLSAADAAWDKSLPAYSIPLMQEGGKAEGRFLSEDVQSEVLSRLDAVVAGKSLQYAVGDGNHSLATAKAHYEEVKKELGEEAKNHPARYALAEIVNIHSPALVFEPIYRAVFTKDAEELLAYLRAAEGDNAKMQTFRYICGEKAGEIQMPATHTLPVGTLQKALDAYEKEHPDCETDYIHGEDSLAAIAAKPGCVGFLFEGMKKEDLFPAVEKDGPLPRKTFSMGHAREKRYYIECRKIR